MSKRRYYLGRHRGITKYEIGARKSAWGRTITGGFKHPHFILNACASEFEKETGITLAPGKVRRLMVHFRNKPPGRSKRLWLGRLERPRYVFEYELGSTKQDWVPSIGFSYAFLSVLDNETKAAARTPPIRRGEVIPIYLVLH